MGISLLDCIDPDPRKACEKIYNKITTRAARLFMPLAELVDLEKEKARIEKELKKNRAELDKLEAKLGNPGFVNKAPAHVVEAEQDRAEKLRALLAKLEESAASMA